MDQSKPVRVLVAGWFSFEKAGAAAGDLIAQNLVCEWLDLAGYNYDVAFAPPSTGGVDWSSVDPKDYSHVVFVCGPFYKSNLLQRFEKCRLVGLNLSMMEPVDSWNPFDLLLERDSSATSRPDITFVAQHSRAPLVGLTLGGTFENAGKTGSNYEIANAAIQRLAASREITAVPIDTRLDIPNPLGFQRPEQIEALIGRMDVVLTTRLHGLVFALKNGVPAIAVDPIPGGDKIRRQAETIGWPMVFLVDDLTNEQLQEAFDYCLTEAARIRATECRHRAVKGVEQLRDAFIAAMSRPAVTREAWGDGRRRGTWIPGGAPLAPVDLGSRILSRLRRRWSR